MREDDGAEEKKVDALDETVMMAETSNAGAGSAAKEDEAPNGRASPGTATPERPPMPSTLTPAPPTPRVSNVSAPQVDWAPRRGTSSRLGKAAAVPRAVLCDLPLLLVFLLYASLLWLSHVHDQYLSEQLRAMRFTDERRAEEITYYTRPCSAEDITARNGPDLFLSPDATPEEAYQHQLRHGFTVFPGVLSPARTAALRAYVAERNTFNITDSESIFVIENENRYSFGLETSHPAVADAMMEIASHPLLKPALERVLGRNPALIEMTAITAAYGAVDQYWHDDVIPTGSAIRYGRTFGPSYSIFVQLQDTTRAMGATEACPGTHYCSAAGVDRICQTEGFQMVGAGGYWHAGDALLMNMNSYHRGKAHTDPQALDRVMLILTFTTKPRDRIESRQLSQGITFSLRWDEWGHTLADMARARKVMQMPWTVLRALGLWKLPGTEWGIDYTTSASMRMTNEDNGFREDEFELFLERGGIWWLPAFLQGEVEEDETWYPFYLDTGNRCLAFVQTRLLPLSVAVYCAVAVLLGTLTSGAAASIKTSARRLCLLGGIAFAVYRLAIRYVDNSLWALDIRFKKRHWGVFKNQHAFGIVTQGPSTLPHRRDVLIETRYGSDYLAMYEDFVDGHPGNRFFHEYVSGAAAAFGLYPELLKNAAAHYVARAVKDHQGRFLYQGPNGAWECLSDAKSVAYTRRQLAVCSHPVKRLLARKMRHILSHYMYGTHRETKMAQKHAVPYLRELEIRLFNESDITFIGESLRTAPIAAVGTAFAALVMRRSLPSLGTRVIQKQRSPFPPTTEPMEPEAGAWLTVGDAVECLEDDEFWYLARVRHITAHGEYLVRWEEGSTGKCNLGYVRPFSGHREGQILEYYDEPSNKNYVCTVLRANEDGTYDIQFVDGGLIYKEVPILLLRRPAEEGDMDVASYSAAY